MSANVTPSQARILVHALGLDRSRNEYRNRYVISAGCDGWADCEALVAAGLMTRHGPRELFGGPDCYCFCCTEAGKEVARANVPAPTRLSRGRRRYLAFLGADCGLSFIEWLKFYGKEVR